jgi:hypothetical protein
VIPTLARHGRAVSRRWPFTILLGVCLGWFGFVAGALAGAAFFVPQGSGLAGPPAVLGYGALGIAVGAVLGTLLASKLPEDRLAAASTVSAMLALAAAAFVVWRILTITG